jgi:MFS transporter, PPP family, 3-phenylpropionic acid transporter
LGFLLTVLGAGSMFERFGMQAFLPIAVLSLVCVVASVWALPSFEVPSVKQLGRAEPMWPVLRQADNLWFFTSVFLHVLAHISLYAFLSLWLDANGYSKAAIGALWALGVAVEIAVLFGQGSLLPRLTWAGWLVLCGAVTALRMGMLAWGVELLWLVILAQCLHGLTFATHHTAVIAIISERAPAHLAGRFQALYAVIGYGLSGVLGGFAGGWLSERFGLQSVFVAAVLVALAATMASERLRRLNLAGP